MNVITSKNFYRRIGRLDPKVSATISKLMNSTSKTTTFVESNKSLDLNVPQNSRSSMNFSSLKTNTNERHNESFTTSNHSNDSVLEYSSGLSSYKINSKSDSGIYTALTEGRGYAEGEIGLATIDINCAILYLTQFSDNFLHSGCIMKLNINNPTQIIVPQTIYNTGSKALDAIRKNFSDIKIVPLPRRHFNAEEGLVMIKSLSTQDCKSSIGFYENRYYALTAASALLKYLKSIQMIHFLPDSIKIEYENRNLRMHIDQESCHRLELLYPLANTKEKKSCLFGLLDNTVTLIGKRYLRARILEPYFDINDIDSMHKCIKELLENPDIFLCLKEKLKIFCNIDKILKLSILPSDSDSFKAVETMLNDILNLKHYLENIIELSEIIKPCQSFILQKLYSNLMDQRLQSMLLAINEIIRPEVKLIKGSAQCFQRIHAIRPQINQFLDMIRDEYNKLTDEIYQIITNLAVQHKLPFRMIYTNTKYFHIQLQLPKSNLHDFDFPAGLNMIYKKGNLIYFTAPEINQINSRITEVIKEAYNISSKIVRELLENLMKFIDGNYLLIETIANLDIIHSFAMLSQCDRYCCPTFGDEMRIVDAIHPLLEHSNTKPVAIPNNIIATPEYNFYVITGPNMGGKTIYIKTIVMLQIMAQLGCYVPAKKAKFRLCDRIFTRIGFEDNIENTRSSFTNEIREIEYIFNNLTTNSLVIIDELCRSTNPIEGIELSWKLCKKLCSMRGKPSENNINDINFKWEDDQIRKCKRIDGEQHQKGFKLSKLTVPFIFITTHFMKLTKLKDFNFNVINLHLAAEEKIVDGKLSIKFTHKVMEGITPIVGYGLSLARIHRFPDKILTRAQEIFDEIMFQEKTKIEENLNKSTYSNDFIKNLEKTLNFDGDQTFEREPPNIAKNITNFMNRIPTNNNNDETESSLENVSGSQLINDFKYQLYDLYADIAAIVRQNPLRSDCENQVKNLLESFRNSMPNDILNKLLKPGQKLEDFKINNNISISNDTNSQNQMKIIEKNNLLEFTTYSSLNPEEMPPANQCVLVENHNPPKIIKDIQIKPPNNIGKNYNNNNSGTMKSDITEAKSKPNTEIEKRSILLPNIPIKMKKSFQLSQQIGKTNHMRPLDLKYWKRDDIGTKKTANDSNFEGLKDEMNSYIKSLQDGLEKGYKDFLTTEVPRGLISPVVMDATNYSNPFGELPNLNNINCSKPTLIYVHLFYSPKYEVLKPLYYLQKKRTDYNIIIMNFAENTFQFHNTVKRYFYDHAYLLYRLILNLNECGCNINNITLAGHGQGAQLAGLASTLLTENSDDNIQIPLLIALDPAPYAKFHLDKSVCKKVVVIHSETTHHLGTKNSVGHIDIYLNSPIGQPGCKNDLICNHIFGIGVLVEAAIKNNILAVNCQNYQAYRAGECDYYNVVTVGLEYDGICKGNYYTLTKPNYPRGLGSNGLGCPKSALPED